MRLFAGLALLGGLAATTSAQTVDEVVARHLAARGGVERIRAVHSVRMSGRVTGTEGRQALVVREVARPARIRTEFTYQGMTGVYACDGPQCWQVSPFDGVFGAQALSEVRSQLAQEQADLDGPLLGAKDKGRTVTLAGRQALGDRQAFVLEVASKAGPVQRLFIDAETYLLVRSESVREVGGHPVKMEATFADQRAEGGLVFPHTIELGVEGRPRRLKVVVEKVELDPALDEARFRMPAAP